MKKRMREPHKSNWLVRAAGFITDCVPDFIGEIILALFTG